MSEVAPKIQAVLQQSTQHRPQAVQETIMKSRQDLAGTFDLSKVIKVGDQLPAFALPDAVDNVHDSSELLKRGPLVIMFYRGEWCPFCNIAIRSMQARLADIEKRGATLVAIAPEKPNGTLTMTGKTRFEVSGADRLT